MPLAPLALSLLSPQVVVPERIDLAQAPIAPLDAVEASILGAALDRLWITGEREGIATRIWTLSAPGAALEPFFLGELVPQDRRLRGVYDLGGGRALLATSTPNSNLLSLYSTDGTASNAELLPILMDQSQLDNVVLDAGRAYLAAVTEATGQELFTTDGTVAGTTLVHEFTAGPLGTEVDDLGLVNNRLVWGRGSQVRGVSTTGGPSDLLIGGSSLEDFSLELAGGRLVFPFTQQLTLGQELYSTDGTVAGTALLREIDAGAPTPGAEGSDPVLLASDGAVTYFSARTDAEGRELWRTDGTTAGTMLVADLTPGPGSTAFEHGSLPPDAAFLGGGLVFPAGTPATGLEPWFTDGTAAGTVLLADIAPGPDSSGVVSPVRVGSSVVFRAFEPLSGFEPWVTDGTPAGTRLLADLAPGPDSGPSSAEISEFAGRGYLIGATPNVGREPLGIDPSSGSVSVAELALDPGNESSMPTLVRSEGGVGYLTTSIGTTFPVVQRLFRTDGTAAGTAELLPGQFGGLLGLLDGRALVLADTPAEGLEPWITDLSGPGATPLGDLFPGPGSSAGSFFGAERLGPFLYFGAGTPTTGLELYRTDGTPQGTELAAELAPGPESGFFRAVAFRDSLFLASEARSSAAASLFISDGTQAGTAPFASTVIGSDPVVNVIRREDRLYFQTTSLDGLVTRLWSTDGSETDVRLERELQQQLLFMLPIGDQILGWSPNALYAVASDSSLELLLSAPGEESVRIATWTATHFYAALGTPGSPSPLWVTDGTSAGTIELAPAALVSSAGIGPLFAASVAEGDEVQFSSGTVDTGFEPWITDGTLAGTRPLADVVPGPAGLEPIPLGRVGDRYLVSGFELETGRELYAFDLEDTGAFAAEPFGQGCGIATLPDLTLEGEARLGGAVRVEVADVSPSAPVLLYAAAGAAFQDLGACTLYLNGLLSIGVGVSTPTGTAGLDFQLSSDPKWLGVPLYLQAAAIQPGAPLQGLVELTNGLELVFGPQ